MNRRQVFVIISNAGDGRNCFAFAMRPTGALMIYLDQDKQCQFDGEAVDRGWLFWLIDVPLPIVVLLFLFWLVVF